MVKKKPVGWKLESVRHSLARKGIKTGIKKTNNKKIMQKPTKTVIKLDTEKYTGQLLSLAGIKTKVIVSGGNAPPREFAFHSHGCGFGYIEGKGVEFKKYFEDQNVELQKIYGFDVFRISKGYPSGFSVSITGEYLSYIADETKIKIFEEQIKLPETFTSQIGACASQDISVKEIILNDIHKQIEKKFPDSYVTTRLD